MIAGKAVARRLEGRTIVRAVVPTARDGHYRTTTHDVVLYLDNGAQVHFVVEETEHGASYGICPVYYPASRKNKRKALK